MGKRKSDAQDLDETQNEEKVSWEDKIKYLNPISQPLATRKLTKKIHKTLKKAIQVKSVVKGVKGVKKSLRRGEQGIVIVAGDVTPLDIISHIPVMCEDKGLQYCYVPSKKDLGESMGSQRITCMALLKHHKDINDDYNECLTKIKELPQAY